MEKLCICGSGKPRRASFDARNIFLTHVCDKCEDQKLKQFRPDVLTNSNYWHDEPINAED